MDIREVSAKLANIQNNTDFLGVNRAKIERILSQDILNEKDKAFLGLLSDRLGVMRNNVISLEEIVDFTKKRKAMR